MGKRVILTLINHLLLISLTCYGCSLPDQNLSNEAIEEDKTVLEQNDSALVATVRKSAHPLSGAAIQRISASEALMKLKPDTDLSNSPLTFERRESSFTTDSLLEIHG